MTSKARARRARTASADRRRQASRNERGNGRAGNAARAAAVGTVRPADGRRLLKVIGLAVGLTLAAIGLIVYLFGVAHVWYGLHDISDTTIYADYAARMAQGLRPYVDFPVEYPPLAIPLFVIPGHSGNVTSYSDWFNVEMFVMCAAAAAATAAAAARLWTTGRKAYLVGVAFAACVLATGAIVGNRYDAAVALVLAVFLLLIAYEMWTVSALVLGIGFALKLTPAILLPLVLRAGRAAADDRLEPRLLRAGRGAAVRALHGARAQGARVPLHLPAPPAAAGRERAGRATAAGPRPEPRLGRGRHARSARSSSPRPAPSRWPTSRAFSSSPPWPSPTG